MKLEDLVNGEEKYTEVEYDVDDGVADPEGFTTETVVAMVRRPE